MTDEPQQSEQPEEPAAQPKPGIPEEVVWEKIGRLSLDNDLLRGRNAFLEGEVTRLQTELDAMKAEQNGAAQPSAEAPAPPPAPPAPAVG